MSLIASAAKLACRIRGHRWERHEAKRICTRCAREEWLFSNPYPSIGEPALYWKHMDWNRDFFPLSLGERFVIWRHERALKRAANQEGKGS